MSIDVKYKKKSKLIVNINNQTMKLLFLAVLIACAQAAPTKEEKLLNGPIEWPLYVDGDYVFLNLSIGTPAVQVPVSIYLQGIDDLRIASRPNDPDAIYDQNDSTSFIGLGVAKNDKKKTIGTLCQETFKIGTNQFTYTPFVIQSQPYPFTNYIGFGPISDDFTFLRSIVSSAVDKTTVIAFDKFPTNGAVTLGGLDKKRCYKDWQLLDLSFWANINDPDHSNSWGVQIDRVSVGKWASVNNVFLSFSVYDEPFLWPRDIYTSIINQLGSVDGKTIPCDVTNSILLTIQGVSISLPPGIYIDEERKEITGQCYLSGSTVTDGQEIRLPQIFFDKYCLSFNFYTGKVGFATRIIN
ncbi:hypothetical protein M3Y97_00994600 [Aphelenchoides bicaudatus]|nr:hypothetical protein M3Y97_00994600 [Aphelenchoides bicaudatus]